jgi:hypothetical protein
MDAIVTSGLETNAPVKVVVSDNADECALQRAFSEESGSHSLRLLLSKTTEDGARVALTAGDYLADPANNSATPGGVVTVSIDTLDWLCHGAGNNLFGHVTLTKVDVAAGILEGSFDLTGPASANAGTHLTGGFHAPVCTGSQSSDSLGVVTPDCR